MDDGSSCFFCEINYWNWKSLDTQHWFPSNWCQNSYEHVTIHTVVCVLLSTRTEAWVLDTCVRWFENARTPLRQTLKSVAENNVYVKNKYTSAILKYFTTKRWRKSFTMAVCTRIISHHPAWNHTLYARERHRKRVGMPSTANHPTPTYTKNLTVKSKENRSIL